MTELLLDIEGMTCASCVGHVERALTGVPSVEHARVSLAARTAAVRCTSGDAGALIDAVERAGYRARIHEARRQAGDDERDLRRRLAVAAFCTFDVLMFSLVVAPGSRGAVLAAWLFATPVQFYGGWPFLRAAIRAARAGTATMDTLVAIGSLAAYAYSAGAAVAGGHHTYFDTAAMIVTLILLGKVLEAGARARAGNAARRLLERQPQEATLLRGSGERRVPVEDLQVGDRVVVRAGEQIPADGIVRSGSSSVDLSMVTGESVPEDVGPGDEVIGASLNGHGRLVVELTRVGQETRLASIVRLLEVTQASKAPIQRVADRVAAVFVPRVLLLSFATFALLWLFGSGGVGAALLRGAAVVLVACPCSLGLATPVAILAGSGRAAQLGVLFKGAEVFEAARRIDTVLIDKTGTLTEGSMRLTAVVPAGTSEETLLGQAAAAEAASDHPIARCVVEAARDRGVEIPEATEHLVTPGAGVRATVGGRTVRVGRPEGLPLPLGERAEDLASQGLTVFAVWRDDEAIGLLGAFDPVKAGAVEAVRQLRGWGTDVAIVSGDRSAAVEAVAAQAGVARASGEMYPEDKVEEVRRLQVAGRRVAFVGDGINDAPALAQADVGIALGTGTDVAMEAGQVLILGGDLRLVVDAVVLARKTFWVIAQNLAWAFAYNLLMIPLAVIGTVSPLVAAAAMAGSSVTVVGNALRLRRFQGRVANGADAPRRLAEIQGRLAPRWAEVRAARERRLEEGPPRRSAVPSDRSGPDGHAVPVPDAGPPPAGDRDGADRTSLARQEARRMAAALERLWANQWEA